MKTGKTWHAAETKSKDLISLGEDEPSNFKRQKGISFRRHAKLSLYLYYGSVSKLRRWFDLFHLTGKIRVMTKMAGKAQILVGNCPDSELKSVKLNRFFQ